MKKCNNVLNVIRCLAGIEWGADTVSLKALRICTGTVHTTPISALQIESGEMPLNIGYKQLFENYWISLKEHGDSHPVNHLIQTCWEGGVVQASGLWEYMTRSSVL